MMDSKEGGRSKAWIEAHNAQARATWEAFHAMADHLAYHPAYRERPVRLEPFGLYTCAPLTIATVLRGSEFYLDLYTDPDYARALLDFVAEGTIARIHAHRRFFGLDEVALDLFSPTMPSR